VVKFVFQITPQVWS